MLPSSWLVIQKGTEHPFGSKGSKTAVRWGWSSWQGIDLEPPFSHVKLTYTGFLNFKFFGPSISLDLSFTAFKPQGYYFDRSLFSALKIMAELLRYLVLFQSTLLSYVQCFITRFIQCFLDNWESTRPPVWCKLWYLWFF